MSTAAQRRGLRGVSKLRRTLRRLEPEAREGIKHAIEKGAEGIKADMMILIPKDTGETAVLIDKKIARDGLTARIGFVTKKAQKDGYVARFIEFGTKGFPDRNVPAQAARPFMQPAFDRNKEWILRDCKREIAKALKKVTSNG